MGNFGGRGEMRIDERWLMVTEGTGDVIVRGLREEFSQKTSSCADESDKNSPHHHNTHSGNKSPSNSSPSPTPSSPTSPN